MKAKTASLLVKFIAVLMLVITWAYRLFWKYDLSIFDTLFLIAAILTTFGDVSLNIIFDKFVTNKDGNNESGNSNTPA